MVEAPQYHTKSALKALELKKEFYARTLERARQGRPVAWCARGVSTEVMDTMDIAAAFPESLGAEACVGEAGVQFLERAEGEGFPPDICSHMRIGLGYAGLVKEADGIPANAPLGGMPKPTMYLATSRVCDPKQKMFEALRRFFDVPTYIYEQMCAPQDIDCTDHRTLQHYIDYNARQLRGFIHFLEEQTGSKLDMKRLRHAVKNAIEVRRLLNDIYELRKSVPSPLPSEDFCTAFWPWMWISNRDEAVDFYRELYEETKQRVANGEGVVPEERFRLLWAGAPHRLDWAFFNYAERRGTVFVMEPVFDPPPPVSIDTSDPVRALAEHIFYGMEFCNSDGSDVRWTAVGGNVLAKNVKEYQIDGVVFYTVRSCRTASIGSKYWAKKLREEWDIPVLIIEGDISDPRAYSPIKAREDFDTFLEVLSSQKKPRAH